MNEVLHADRPSDDVPRHRRPSPRGLFATRAANAGTMERPSAGHRRRFWAPEIGSGQLEKIKPPETKATNDQSLPPQRLRARLMANAAHAAAGNSATCGVNAECRFDERCFDVTTTGTGRCTTPTQCSRHVVSTAVSPSRHMSRLPVAERSARRFPEYGRIAGAAGRAATTAVPLAEIVRFPPMVLISDC